VIKEFEVEETVRSADNSEVVQSATIERIIDGDTIECTIDGDSYRVRFIGVNTPEMYTVDSESGKKEPVPQPYALEAKEFVESILVAGGVVYLETDVADVDKYNRLLRYVYVDAKNVGSIKTSINHMLVEKGYATVMTIPPNDLYSIIFNEAAEEARDKKLGLWSVSE